MPRLDFIFGAGAGAVGRPPTRDLAEANAQDEDADGERNAGHVRFRGLPYSEKNLRSSTERNWN